MDNAIPDMVLSDNTSQRLPCVLLLDGSGSMSGAAIDGLNEGLKTLESELKKDDIAAQRVQLMVIRVGELDEVEIVQDWTDAIDFSAPTITANGSTPLGAGMLKALENIEAQKQNYKDHGIPYNRPWIFLITDGEPTDQDWQTAADQAREAEEQGKVIVFCIGTEGANFESLGQFSTRSPMKLTGLNFKELFVWLSRSASAGSQAAQGDQVQLPAVDWGVVTA